MTVRNYGPSYRDDVSEAYDLGYRRGFINAPRSEHYEHYDSAGWLEGWEDGQTDWVPGTGFRDT